MDETCAWCSPPIDVHYDGGCQIDSHADDEPVCACSHDADFHCPDPDRPDPWAA